MKTRTQVVSHFATFAFKWSLLCGIASGAMQVYTAVTSASAWISKAPMSTARGGVGAVELNGLLYVIGGGNASGAVAALEIFDPSSNTWKTKAPMPTGRSQMAVGAIGGKIYAAGGYNGGTRGELEVYDPATDKWTSRASMPVPTESRGAVVNGKLYVIGGNSFGFCSSVVQMYDPANNTWSLKAAMPTARCHVAVTAFNGLIYVFGGTTTGGSVFSTLEVYNPATDAWTTKASMPTPRSQCGADVLNGLVHVVGGGNGGGPLTTAEAYNPVNNTWSAAPSMLGARAALDVRTVNGVLYASGGIDNNGNLATVEAYSPFSPIVTSQPQNLTVTVGNTASFSVTATGTALTYQWEFNGINLLGATGPTLTLANVQTTDAGTYSVRVSNQQGSVVSAPAVLRINIPIEVIVQPQSTSVTVGGSVSFNVSAIGSPPLTYQWRFNGANLPGATGPRLTLVNVQMSDAGNYTVLVSNQSGSVISQEAQLKVKAQIYFGPTGARWEFGHFLFSVSGNAGDTYQIEISTDLIHWAALGTIINVSGSLLVTDPRPTDPTRFYRLKLL